MDYSNPSRTSGTYLTLDRAVEISRLTLPELKRAILLGFIKVADIGNTTFVDSLSLNEYLHANSSNSSDQTRVDSPSPYFQRSKMDEEDNHPNSKEREVFREALARDMAAGAGPSLAPYISIGVLSLIALILAFPTSQNSEVSSISTKEYYTLANLKEITTENVNSLLTQTSSAHKISATAPVDASVHTEPERRDYFTIPREKLNANAFEVWLSTIKEGIDRLALGVFETIETFVEPLR